MKYNDLLDLKNGERISYWDLLSTTEWRDKRQEIIDRDKVCTKCYEPTIFLVGKGYRPQTPSEKNEYWLNLKKEIVEILNLNPEEKFH